MIESPEIEELKRQRDGLNMTKPVEYRRISYKIRRLRDPEGSLKKMYEWRKKHAAELRYSRLKYVYPRKPVTFSQAKRKSEACIRHSKNNPQRQARHRIERCLHGVYNECAFEIRKSNRGPKYTKSEWLLGCTVQEFKEHIKVQLDRLGLRWIDWKMKWTMDHVIPVRRFDLPREQQSCWHYTNLRPLPKTLNSNRGFRNYKDIYSAVKASQAS